MGTRPVGHRARMRPGALHALLGPGGQLGHDLGMAAAVANEGSACQPPPGPCTGRPRNYVSLGALVTLTPL